MSNQNIAIHSLPIEQTPMFGHMIVLVRTQPLLECLGTDSAQVLGFLKHSLKSKLDECTGKECKVYTVEDRETSRVGFKIAIDGMENPEIVRQTRYALGELGRNYQDTDSLQNAAELWAKETKENEAGFIRGITGGVAGRQTRRGYESARAK